MQYYQNIYEKIISLENLFSAWHQFKRDKRYKADVQRFERDLEENIFAIHGELVAKSYRHGPYHSFYIRDPKQRHIHKATVRDRVVHHAVFSVFNSLFEPTFIAASFSCRIGKGTHKGVAHLERLLRRVSHNYTKTCFALKCDIQKFFDSVDHEILLRIIGKRVKDPDAMWLIRSIIGSFKSESRERERERESEFRSAT